ncbi:MAG TPA: hypothetical protein VNO30_17760 [Kofleriaceae bacterium]|nr:hypothetical protein [Kofleriaceae bacterium]
MKLGDSFHISGHLWIVVSIPATDGSVAMVNLTSHRQPCDETCVLDVGDHPFVRHKTIVAYAFAQMVPVSHHARVLQQPRGAAADRKLLERIWRGAKVSLATPPKVLLAIEATLAAQAKPAGK